MGLSLKELKEQLIAKQGYTITPAHNQLNDLKVLVDDMMNVRSASPPSSGSGRYSGTNCIGHIVESGYKLSLGDINALDIKGCSCHTVNDRTAYCRSRTYSCSCNSNTPVCNCNLRTGTCSCNSNTPVCNCNLRTGTCSCNSNVPTCDCNTRTATTCDCNSRTALPTCNNQSCSCRNVVHYSREPESGDIFVSCDCYNRTAYLGDCEVLKVKRYTCDCVSRTSSSACTCNSRTPDPCDCKSRTSSCGTVSPSECTCVSRTSSCGTVSPSECTCVSRTSSCGSRSTTSCTCNGRCACNSEKRFE